jgi:hypothetical protein
MRIGIDTENLKRVTTDDGCPIPAQYQEFVHVFSEEMGDTFQLDRPIDHAINLESDYKVQLEQIQNLCVIEVNIHKDYIETNLEHGFIQWSTFSAAAPTLFANRTDGRLLLCLIY